MLCLFLFCRAMQGAAFHHIASCFPALSPECLAALPPCFTPGAILGVLTLLHYPRIMHDRPWPLDRTTGQLKVLVPRALHPKFLISLSPKFWFDIQSTGLQFFPPRLAGYNANARSPRRRRFSAHRASSERPTSASSIGSQRSSGRPPSQIAAP